MANKYLALNIILWQNKNATVISVKSHEKKNSVCKYEWNIYIFLVNANRNLFRRSNEKSDTISKFGSSRTFMNSNRYEIANQWLEKRRRKYIQIFLWKIALYVQWIIFGHNAINDHVFDALWWPFSLILFKFCLLFNIGLLEKWNFVFLLFNSLIDRKWQV